MRKELHNNKKIQIQTQINFAEREEGSTDRGMRFTPERQLFHQEFQKLLEEMKKVFDDQKNEVQRVITNQDLMPLVTGLITESGPKFNTIVETSFKYNTLSRQILQQLDDDMSFLEKKSLDWEKVREIYEEKRKYNQEEFFAENRTVDPIKAQLIKLTDWQQKLSASKQSEPKGIISMDARVMKTELENFLRESHKRLRDHAYSIGRGIYKQMESSFEEIKKMISATYVDLGQFVTFTTNLQYAKDMEVTL